MAVGLIRGDVVRLRMPRTRGHEQHGARFGVVVQSDELLVLSTVLVAPTSRSAQGAPYRPEIVVAGDQTRVLVEQVAALDPGRFGEVVDRLDHDEIRAVDRALELVLGL